MLPLPLEPATVTPDPDAIKRLKAICERLSPVPRRQDHRTASLLPSGDAGWAAADREDAAAGPRLATGYNVWGILNAPATGEALAELIDDGAPRRKLLSQLVQHGQ
jgi:glycine/D-amino acid oxidase-like deaminating enzyme